MNEKKGITIQNFINFSLKYLKVMILLTVTLNAANELTFSKEEPLIIIVNKTYNNYYDGNLSINDIKEEFKKNLNKNCLDSHNTVSCMTRKQDFEKLNNKGFKYISFSKQKKNLEFGSIGIYLNEINNQIKVKKVLKYSTCKNLLNVDNIILEIDNEKIITIDDAIEKLQGKKDTFVNIKIKDNEVIKDIQCERKIIKEEEYEIITKNEKTLEFKLKYISKDSLNVLKKELNETVYKKIVLDLTDNYGTSLNNLVTLFSYFIKDDKKNIIQWKEYIYEDKLDILYKKIIEEDMRTFYKDITIKINETTGAGTLLFSHIMKKNYGAKVIYTENKEKKRQTTGFLKNVNPIYESDEGYYLTTYPIGVYVDDNNNSLSDKTWIELEKMIMIKKIINKKKD